MTDKEAFESSLPKEINIYLQDGSILDNENVVEDSMVWTTTLCDEDYITIGKCCPSSFEIMIFSDANYPEKKTRINPIIKVTDEDNITHEMDLGLYYVYSSSRTDDKLHRDIVAYDYFYSLSVLPINDFINRFFEETTIYSFTFKELRTSFYKEFGIIDDTPEEDHLVIINDVTIDNKAVVSAGILKIKNNAAKNKKIKDHFIEDAFEKKQILDKIGFQYNNLRKVKVYIEQV